VDSEHASSATASLFNNGTFGWPAILGANLPSGGPAYPLATPGVRAKYLFDQNTSWLVALFNGDPAPAGPGDAQVRNPHGLDFRLRQGAYLVTEAQRTNTIRARTPPACRAACGSVSGGISPISTTCARARMAARWPTRSAMASPAGIAATPASTA
jgi:hypothetical protein